jgi:cell division protease FtsH
MGLGYTLHFPEDERQLITRSELQNRICCLLGGIVAEDIVFDESSTGAMNDLQRATGIARRMVTEFGMSPKLGRVYYGENNRSTYLGNGAGYIENLHSEDTVREIDLEVQQIIGEASTTAHEILTNRRAALDHMARELVECEVMDADHLKRILDQYKTKPQISPGTRTKLLAHDADSDAESAGEGELGGEAAGGA